MILARKLCLVLKAIHFPDPILPHVDLGVCLHQFQAAVAAAYPCKSKPDWVKLDDQSQPDQVTASRRNTQEIL